LEDALDADALALVAAGALVVGEAAEELVLLEHAVTAARPRTASAATPLVALILMVISVSFRTDCF
jgi:hypothetical protein